MSSLLVILSYVNTGLDWNRVRYVVQNIHFIRQVSVYTTRDTSPSRTVLFCLCDGDASKIKTNLPSFIQDFPGVLQSSTEYRLYNPITGPHASAISGATNADLPHNHIMIFNAMTPEPSSDQQFNDWYLQEHIPLLRRVPTWISSERFLLESTTDLAPQYLALHRWNDTSAFDTEEYKTATNTPWRTAVIAEVIKKERIILAYEERLSFLKE